VPATRLSLVILAALALVSGLSACGGGSGGSASTAGVSTVTTTPSGATGPGKGTTTPPAAPGDAAADDSCQGRLGAFVGSMDSLRRRLSVGMTYDQYVDEVKAVRDTYGKVDAGAVEIDCLAAVGTPAEKAFNRYIEAANDWGGCVSEAGCESADIEPVLQRQWRIAAHFLGEAREGLGEETAKAKK
jgi:hypothetical protein